MSGSLESAKRLDVVQSLGRVVQRGWGLKLELQSANRESGGAAIDVVVAHKVVAHVRARTNSRALVPIGEDERLEALLSEVAAHVARHVGTRVSIEGGSSRDRYGKIVGASQPMQELYAILDKVIASESTVLIQGDNGTGKELVARAIHSGSIRADRPFVVQNCSAFNENLLDSELFGHKRGAFTGAVVDKPGLFEVANNGTFFLDEIGDMSPALQVKVLRVLQEGTLSSVGDTVVKHVDVRIIAATNRDLTTMVNDGIFREDLFYRVNVINLVVPPLRHRLGDVELLAHTFLDREAGRAGGAPSKRLSDVAMARLARYGWPGNVRELENEIERAVVLAGSTQLIDVDLLSPRIVNFDSEDVKVAEDPRSLPEAVRQLERKMIRDSLIRNDWNKTRAAKELAVSRRNLIRLVQKYELQPN